MNIDPFGFLQAHVAIWLAVTLLLGGSAAVAAGRALALAWRPLSRLFGYMLLLSAFTSFLCWALFSVPVIPAGRIIARVGKGDWAEAFSGLGLLGVSFALLVAIGAAAFVATRALQMRRQYPFLAPRSGDPEKL